MEREKNRILLVGKDPLFAWALEQSVGGMGYHLEHVYTVGEARIRLNRFTYAAVLADGLGKDDVDVLAQECRSGSAMFVFDDINLETPPRIVCNGGKGTATVVPKEQALPKILSSLKNLH